MTRITCFAQAHHRNRQVFTEKKYPQAEELLNKFNNNVKQTKLFTDRWTKVEEYHMKLNQQRQQQYFQQQQQQQQQQRQRQQQYRGAPPHQQQRNQLMIIIRFWMCHVMLMKRLLRKGIEHKH